MKKVIIFLSATLLCSCSNYVAKLHQEMDEGTANQSMRQSRDLFDVYRNSSNPPTEDNFKNQRQYMSPRTPIQNVATSNNTRSYMPPMKREYRPSNEVKRRFQADDLVDDSSNGSLWASPNSTTSLFSDDERKGPGDILIIKVQDKLKDDISMTLKKVYPQTVKKTADKKPASAPETPEVKPDEKEKKDFHDKISSVVVEEISKDHLLLRGRKSLLYHNRKRLVEVQAMIARKDIDINDSINSNDILETSVQVLR